MISNRYLVFVLALVEEHPCFGKGAVRATRVRQAVAMFSCVDWGIVFLSALVVSGLGVAVVLAIE